MIEPDTEQRRDGQADERPDQDPDRALVGGCRLAGQEERGLDAFADDRDEGQGRERRDGAVVERAVDGGLEFAPTLAAWRRIQNSIQVTTPAAARSVTASNSCSYGSWKLPTVRYRPIPKTALRTIARPAPGRPSGSTGYARSWPGRRR